MNNLSDRPTISNTHRIMPGVPPFIGIYYHRVWRKAVLDEPPLATMCLRERRVSMI